MSLFRQGKRDEGRKLATEAVARMKPLPADENNPLAEGIDDGDLIMWLAYKEAKAMLPFDAAPPPPRHPTGNDRINGQVASVAEYRFRPLALDMGSLTRSGLPSHRLGGLESGAVAARGKLRGHDESTLYTPGCGFAAKRTAT